MSDVIGVRNGGRQSVPGRRVLRGPGDMPFGFTPDVDKDFDPQMKLVREAIAGNAATTLKTTVEENNGVFTTLVVSIVVLASLLFGVIVAIAAIGVTRKIGIVLNWGK